MMDMKKLQTLKRSRLIQLCFAITFFTSGIIVNFVQCILYLTLHKINKRLYRKLNWYCCYSIYSQLVFMCDWWSGSEVILYANQKDFDNYWGKEHAYCVMNHSYEIDWLVGWMLCDRIHMLGNCKAYAKRVIQYMPVLGWCWKFSEFVFLERSFEKDRETIRKQVTELSEHPDPMWLLLFPEGTRFTEKKHAISLEFAREKNLPQLKHHLLPRTKGFVASLPSMVGKVPAVYDIELAFKENDTGRPTMTGLLLGYPVTAHLYMKRIPMEDIPATEEEQEEFLRQLFIEKDKLKESFINTGDFFETSGIEKTAVIKLPRRVNSLVNIAVWFVVILCPIGYSLIKLLFSGELLYFSIGMSIIGIFFVLLNKTIGMSKISKGSSYGANSPKKVD
ncbi:1-acyl-sn-glycerol-3-phosphate acyltransferase gamma-like [Onthophagus taurus]|uniref:1-acyl-sn-glycerol-3-phosphate acyltransferase gamma-like n=1 Tax=Onthophagus taurus TaxID=166361 RepID=UPI000C208BC6|nr:1-acyl-sn-glycerol-3-phosphate acyltransferase gamma-like [Onthophagus taurus]XP_022914210.1 1-acyl-sn-glycerol-3-phosphate acyltransferase gamma-like [Onthophagus taurus]XP_022914211.1 1-acyl-sn-glycerol-3-phosphate acyltransferase gamma-like [Onthophagus taurus]XP_022914212.1 1-acyl-sn-glycerol-3-phosphate acyltransferase gamma-like [Onthophagus taurus]